MNGPRYLFFEETRQNLFYTEGENNRVLRPAATVAPAAATVSISGQVNAGEHALANVRTGLTGAGGTIRAVKTNSFGFFTISNAQSGATYVITIHWPKTTLLRRRSSLSRTLSGLTIVGRE